MLLSAIDFSPHLASPVGEGLVTLSCDYQLVINIRSNQHLPNGGEREGAEGDWKKMSDNHCASQGISKKEVPQHLQI